MKNIPENMILSGVVGSTAYGLNGPDSDIDRMGVYAAPTREFHGLTPPVGSNDSVVFKDPDPDATYHEALKWITLVLKGNPSVIELLWLPEYEVLTALGEFIVNRRVYLLGASNVRKRYLGYASGQFQRLTVRGDGSFASDTRKQTAKHARHILRLLDQGFELYSTGQLTVRVNDPQKYHDFGAQVAAPGGQEIAAAALAEAEERFDSVKSPLLEQPDMVVAEAWLRMVRAHYLK